jgi:hypothetical protein
MTISMGATGDDELQGTPLVFDPVWLILERPRPNLDPPRFFAPGRLTIGTRRSEFRPSTATPTSPSISTNVQLRLDQVVGVSVERYGWGLAPPVRRAALRHRRRDRGCLLQRRGPAWVAAAADRLEPTHGHRQAGEAWSPVRLRASPMRHCSGDLPAPGQHVGRAVAVRSA